MEEIINNSMESYNNYLNNIVIGCQDIIESIQKNEKQAALKLISQFSEGITWLTEINRRLKGFGYNVELNNSLLQNMLNDINGALTLGDFVLVADIFEYEVKEYFSNCEKYRVEQAN